MGAKKLWIAGAAVAVVASAALLVPSIALGAPMGPLAPLFPGQSVSDKHEDGPGTNGQGKAWGHNKDSDDFPGKNGKGKGNPHNNPDAEDGADGTPGNGQGKAWGHDKDSENFPGKNGKGKGNPHNDEDADE
ncbi:hypothetical protein [Microbacterium sp. 2FI]|uniref:hypothetical protein n=1 Tax=Microbacterium sp. 2FI TaxID=2502193 RepID=UPI0010F5CD2F|nr:hypothetical protein [Microbacterium sp. 2FI]